MVVAVDYLVGPEFVLAILYLFPILYAAWFLGLTGGLLAAVASWLAALHNAGVFTSELHKQPLHVLFNAGSTLAFFCLTAWLSGQLSDKQKKLQQLVDVDHVTGAATARRFYALAENEVYRLARYRHPLTIAYLDVDNFKRINDTLGHAAGDTVLKMLVTAIQDDIRASDCVARLGGDEFAILLPETSADAARTLITKIHTKLNERMQGSRLPVTFSIGVVTCLQETSVNEALKKADALMYEAKRAGKNSIVFEAR
jgi:diguanylate cyclase (GGDEF)-like protein